MLVRGQEEVVPLAILRAPPIGIMEMKDQGEEDDKIVAVHADDREYVHYPSTREPSPHRVGELRPFFEDYKALENKTVIVNEFLDREESLGVIRDAMDLYSKHRDELRAGKRLQDLPRCRQAFGRRLARLESGLDSKVTSKQIWPPIAGGSARGRRRSRSPHK
jgi:hypothetical protein